MDHERQPLQIRSSVPYLPQATTVDFAGEKDAGHFDSTFSIGGQFLCFFWQTLEVKGHFIPSF